MAANIRNLKESDKKIPLKEKPQTRFREWFKHQDGERPIAEPPMFHYEQFIDECVPSDLRFEQLFLNSVEKRTAYRDLYAQCELDWLYQDWVSSMKKRTKADGAEDTEEF